MNQKDKKYINGELYLFTDPSTSINYVWLVFPTAETKFNLERMEYEHLGCYLQLKKNTRMISLKFYRNSPLVKQSKKI